VTAAIAAVAIAACASERDVPPGFSADELPSCSVVWVEGKTLPAHYDGCMAEDGMIAPAFVDCAGGGQFTTYDDRFYALIGGKIAEADNGSQDYLGAYSACMGATDRQ